MTFNDTEFTLRAANSPIPVRITGDALHCFWGANTGPQTAEGLILKHRAMLEDIVGDKIIAGDVGSDGVVVVNGMDVEG